MGNYFDSQELKRIAEYWRDAVDWSTNEPEPDSPQEDESELLSFIGEVERAGRDQGLQKALAEYVKEEEPLMRAHVPNGTLIELYLLSPRERHIGRKLAEEFGEGFGEYPAYIEKPDAFFAESECSYSDEIRHYVVSGQAKDDYDNCHIDSQSAEVLAILREGPSINSYCFDPFSVDDIAVWLQIDLYGADWRISIEKPPAKDGMVYLALYERWS